MSKITVKSTKEQMTSYLNEVFKSVQKANKNLAERIIYTSKVFKEDQSKVTKKDLYDLCKEAMALNLTPATPVMAEASVKPKKKVTKKAKPADEEKAETPTEEPEETPAENTEETPKAPAKASGKKKAVTKKSAKKEEEPIVKSKGTLTKSKQEVALAEMFKEKIESETLGTLEIAHDIKTMDDLKKSVDADELLVFAMYWTPRHIVQFGYTPYVDLKYRPTEFKDDVDLATLVYIGENNPVAIAVSSEYDVPYIFTEKDLKEYSEGLRLSNGCEYQIYRQTAEPKEA